MPNAVKNNQVMLGGGGELPNTEKCKYTRIYAGGHAQPPRKLAESAIHALCKYLTSKNVCILSTERDILSVRVHVTLFFTKFSQRGFSQHAVIIPR
jgi:hypothetical protein